MSAEPSPSPAAGGISYIYRPSLLGAPREFRISDDGLAWSYGGRAGFVPFQDIRRLRMSFKPASMQSQRYVTEIWPESGPKLTVVSSSWKSMVEQERLDKAYSTFVAELHRRIGLTRAPVLFEQGVNPLMYWPGVVVFVALAIALIALLGRALLDGSFGGAAFVAAFLAFFAWQSGNFFRRNRPGRYGPDAVPALLLPGL